MHLNVCSLVFIIFLLFNKVSCILVEMVEDQSASLFYIYSLKKCFAYFRALFSWKIWLCFWITLITQILFISQNNLGKKKKKKKKKTSFKVIFNTFTSFLEIIWLFPALPFRTTFHRMTGRRHVPFILHRWTTTPLHPPHSIESKGTKNKHSKMQTFKISHVKNVNKRKKRMATHNSKHTLESKDKENKHSRMQG